MIACLLLFLMTFKYAHFNVLSLVPKYSNFKDLILIHKYDFVAITETWLHRVLKEVIFLFPIINLVVYCCVVNLGRWDIILNRCG